MEEKKVNQQEIEGTVAVEGPVMAEEALEVIGGDAVLRGVHEKRDQVNQTKIEMILKAHVDFLASLAGGVLSEKIGAGTRRAVLDGVDLHECDLGSANLAFACMADTDLSCANLREAQLQEADLREAWLVGTDLRGADLSDADLRGADLSKADLSCSHLCGAHMEGADLCGANLAFVDWWGVDLSGINLSGARNLCALDVLAAIAAAHGMPSNALEYEDFQAIANDFARICPQVSAPMLAFGILELVDIIIKKAHDELVDDEPFMYPTFQRLLHKALSARFKVVLEDFHDNKIAAIEAVCGITGLGLKEAKELVASTPASIKDCANEDEAAKIKDALEAAGCTVALK